MNLLSQAYQYFVENQDLFFQELGRHLRLSGLALLIATLICVPLGIWAARRAIVAQTTINVANALRVVPSLAIMFLAFPYFGLGPRSALIALVILACPPILINTYAGFRSVDRSVVEAARGMGMAAGQVLRKVETPLALPVVIAGLRIATVEVIASASLAAFIGAGGLGLFIQRGFSNNNVATMLVGTIPVALLALLAEAILASVQRVATVEAR